MKQYVSNGSHDAALLEVEADRGAIMFEKFYRFTTQRNGSNSVEDLLSSPALSNSTKISRIRKWWHIFEQHNKPKATGPVPRFPFGGMPK